MEGFPCNAITSPRRVCVLVQLPLGVRTFWLILTFRQAFKGLGFKGLGCAVSCDVSAKALGNAAQVCVSECAV